MDRSPHPPGSGTTNWHVARPFNTLQQDADFDKENRYQHKSRDTTRHLEQSVRGLTLADTTPSRHVAGDVLYSPEQSPMSVNWSWSTGSMSPSPVTDQVATWINQMRTALSVSRVFRSFRGTLTPRFHVQLIIH